MNFLSDLFNRLTGRKKEEELAARQPTVSRPPTPTPAPTPVTRMADIPSREEMAQPKSNAVSLSTQLEKVTPKPKPKQKPNAVLNGVTNFAEAGNQFLGHLGTGLINDAASTVELAHKVGQYTPGGLLNKAITGKDQPELVLPRISVAKSGNSTIDAFGTAGDVTKEGVELIPAFKAGNIANDLAKGTKLVKSLETGGRAAQYASKVLPLAADAVGGGIAQVGVDAGKEGSFDHTAENFKNNMLIGGATALGLPVVGGLLSKALSPVLERFRPAKIIDAVDNMGDDLLGTVEKNADEVAPGINSVNPNREADAARAAQEAAQKAEAEAAQRAAAAAEAAPNPTSAVPNPAAALPGPNGSVPVPANAPLPNPQIALSNAPSPVQPVQQLPVQQSFIPELNQGGVLSQADEAVPNSQVIDPTAPVDPSLLDPNASQVAPSPYPEDQLLVSPPPANGIDDFVPEQVVDDTLPAVGADDLGPQDVVPATPEPMVNMRSPLTGEDVGMNKRALAEEVAGLESIDKGRRTAQQEARLQQLRKQFEGFDEEAVDAINPSTADRFPGLNEEDQRAVDDVMAALGDAQRAADDVGGVRTTERGQRLMDAEKAFADAGGGSAGMEAKMRALKGEYSKSQFNPLKVTDESQQSIYNDIEGSNLRGWEKTNTQQAFSKLWGAIDEKPTTSDIRYIRDYYNSKSPGLGDIVSKQVTEAVEQASKMSKKDLALLLAGAPRTMMTIGDFSAPRQAGVLMAGHPIQGIKAMVNGMIDAFKPQRYAKDAKAMAEAVDQNGANYSDFMSRVMGLQMPHLPGAMKEEGMSSAALLSKVPLYGKVVRGSERAFSRTLGELRYNVAKGWIDAAGGIDAVTKNFSQQEIEKMGEALNTLSGRGGSKGGFTDKHADILSKTLFSGRLWSSRLNMINPYWYYRLSPPARKEAARSMASFATLVGGTLALADGLPGVEVGHDPLSADFAKIKVGNTRYDILGGLQQNLRVGYQMFKGEKVNSNTGELTKTGHLEPALGFAEGKLSPLLGFGLKLGRSVDDEDESNPLIRKDEYNQPFNAGVEAGKLALPLGVTGTAETADDTGSVVKAAAMNAPALFGTGVQTYGNQKTKDAGDFTKGKDMNALRKQLKDNKIPLTEDGLTDLAAIKDWDNAVLAAQYRLGDLELDKKATKVSVINAKQKLEQFQFAKKNGFLPNDTDAIKSRAESGDYDKAIEAMEFNIKSKRTDKDTPPSELKKAEDAITKLKVAKDNKYGPNLIQQYNDINLSEWRSMGDPESDDYNPEIYQTLWDIDNALAGKGVSRNADHPNETFLSAKKGKGRGKGGSSGAQGNTIGSAIDLGKVSLGKLAGKQTGVAPVPVIKKLKARDLVKKRKISVSKA